MDVFVLQESDHQATPDNLIDAKSTEALPMLVMPQLLSINPTQDLELFDNNGLLVSDNEAMENSSSYEVIQDSATDQQNTTQSSLVANPHHEFCDSDITSSTEAIDHSFVFESKLNIRANEETELLQAYERLLTPNDDELVATTEFVIISGPTGVGKTTLAQSLRDRVMSDGGIFCHGKFDSLQSHEPYAAFVSAFTEFTDVVVERGEETVASTRQKILSAVGTEGKVLTDTIPALAKILGNQLERSHAISPSDVMNQFKFLFRMFLRAVCSPERPLVLFLDDIHWADESSITLLQSLAADVSNKGILFIGTIRDDVLPCRKLEDGLEQLRRSNVHVTRVQLQNLQDEVVNHMLSQMLQLQDNQILPLTSIIQHQTNGNLFFILEMLDSLHKDGLLHYDNTKSSWSWNDQDIRLTFQQTSVSELVTDRIFQLPKEAQDVLKVAACLGSKLNVELLCHVLSVTVETYLEMAVEIGLLSTHGNPKSYYFAHDGIREATYNLIPISQRPSFHLDVGRSLKHLEAEKLENYIFVVLGQLEQGKELIQNRSERTEVASLCLRGGAHAARSSSFKTASKFFLWGIALLDERRSWRDEYEMILELHNCAAEVEYCIGHFASLDSLVETVISKARSFRDTLRIRACLVYSLGGRNLMTEAIDQGLDVLKNLGVCFPKKPGRFDLMVTLRRTRLSIRRFTPEEILTLPLMRDQDKLAAMQLMNLLFLYAFSSQSLLAPLVVCRMVDLTLDHGLCAMSSCSMVLFASLQIGVGHRVNEGFLYGELGFDLYHKFGEKAWLGRLSAAYYAFVCGWKHPFKETLAPLKKAHRVALETGDIEMAMMNANIYCWSALEFETIPVLEKEIQSFANRMERHGQESTFFMIKPLWQMCQNLLGMGAGDPKVLTGNIIDQDDYLDQARSTNPPSVMWSNLYIAILAYLFGDNELAEECVSSCRNLVLYPFCSFSCVNVVFFDALTALALLRKDWKHRVRRIKVARRAIKIMSRWSDDAPINFLGKLFLVKAELAAAMGTHKAALTNFTCAIALSSKGGFLMLEALANERAGRYFLERRDLSLAARHFHEAHTLYVKWGGCAKAEELQKDIDRLFES